MNLSASDTIEVLCELFPPNTKKYSRKNGGIASVSAAAAIGAPLALSGVLPIIISAGAGIVALKYGYDSWFAATRDSRESVKDEYAYHVYDGFTNKPRKNEISLKDRVLSVSSKEVLPYMDGKFIVMNGVKAEDFKLFEYFAMDEQDKKYYRYFKDMHFSVRLKDAKIKCMCECHGLSDEFKRYDGKELFIAGRYSNELLKPEFLGYALTKDSEHEIFRV